MRYDLRVIPTGPLAENCVLVKCCATNKGFIFDPGAEANKIIKNINDMKMQPVLIANTHAHYDHIGAVDELRKKYNIPFAVHEKEAEYLPDPAKNYSFTMGAGTSLTADQTFAENDLLACGEVEFKVLHTPGHTFGGSCFYTPGLLVAGDTIFASSIGRGDLYGGDENLLIRMIQQKILTLPDETVIVCGHGENTSVGQEKRENPYL